MKDHTQHTAYASSRTVRCFVRAQLTTPRNTFQAETYRRVNAMVTEADWQCYLDYLFNRFPESRIAYEYVGTFRVITVKVCKGISFDKPN